MRPFSIFLLFVTIACRAQDKDDITRRVHEGVRGNDGRPKYRVESVFRAGQRVMVVMSRPNTGGVYVATSRAYYAGRDLVAIESDEDRDGFFESLVVYRSGTKDMEAFTRQRDGSVQPVSAQKLRVFKKQNVAISDFADRLLDKDADPEKLQDAIHETEKKKTEEKK